MAERRPRTGLTREKVLDAALAHLDRYGLEALSLRKLGAALGVEGMTLYHYVPSKAALLDGIVERLVQMADAEITPRPDEPWPELLRHTAEGLHTVLRRHPAALHVLATRPVTSPAAVAVLENALDHLVTRGAALGTAMDALNAVTAFVIGHTLAEVGTTPGTDGESDPTAAIDAQTHPRFARAVATGAGLDFDARFTLVVDILVKGFEARVP